ncbi:MAG: tetratricopeptide repeat protein [Acidiferrobacteraceae bacterium]
MIKCVRLVGVLLVSSLFAACSTLPTRPSAAPVPAPKAVSYPRVALTQKLMYDVLLGEIAGERGDFNVSIKYLADATAQTKDPRLARRTTEIALYTGQYGRARTAAKIWVKAEPKSLAAHEAYAQALLGAGQPRMAEEELATVLRLSAADQRASNYLAIAGLLAHQPAGTNPEAIMQRLVALYPRSAHAYFALARLDVERTRLRSAETAINQTLAFKPAWEEAAIFKGRILMLEGHAEQAARFYRSFLYTYPQATELRLNYARYLVNVKDWSAALDQFRRVVRDLPDDAEANYATGLLAMQMSQYAEAEKYLERTLSLQPGNHQVEIDLGDLAEERGDYPRAQYWFGRGAHGASLFPGELHLALLLAREGHLVQAEAKLHVLKTVSKRQQVELVLAKDEVLSRQHRYPAALRRLSRGLRTHPDNTQLLYARALVELKLGRLHAHERDLRAILKKDPQNVEALNALGYTLTNHSTRYQEAFSLIARALKLQPGDPYIMDSMGWADYRLGHLKAATKYLRQALSVRPDAEISAHLGEVLWRRGNHEEAETVWKHALKQDPESAPLKRTMQKFMH